MTIPKKASRVKVGTISDALEFAEDNQADTNSSNTPKKNLQNQAENLLVCGPRVGRPSPRDGYKTEKVFVIMTQETHERLEIALPQVRAKRRKKGDLLDKSLLVEEAIIEWLDHNNF